MWCCSTKCFHLARCALAFGSPTCVPRPISLFLRRLSSSYTYSWHSSPHRPIQQGSSLVRRPCSTDNRGTCTRVLSGRVGLLAFHCTRTNFPSPRAVLAHVEHQLIARPWSKACAGRTTAGSGYTSYAYAQQRHVHQVTFLQRGVLSLAFIAHTGSPSPRAVLALMMH